MKLIHLMQGYDPITVEEVFRRGDIIMEQCTTHNPGSQYEFQQTIIQWGEMSIRVYRVRDGQWVLNQPFPYILASLQGVQGSDPF